MRTKTPLHLIAISLIAAMLTTSCEPTPPEGNDPPTTHAVSASTPRYLAAAGGKIYVTCYTPCGVMKIDTLTQQREAFCKLSQYHPEGICVNGGYLYVASGNIADENNNYIYNNKIYKIELLDFELCDSIEVGPNPVQLISVDDNHIAVCCSGDYASDFGGTYLIDVNTNETQKLDETLYKIEAYNNHLYGYTNPYGTLKFYKYDINTLQKEEILSGWNHNSSPYGINIDPSNGDIYITTNGNYTSNGDVLVYNNDGSVKHNAAEALLLPSKVAFHSGNQAFILNEGSWGGNNAEISLYNTATGAISNSHFSNSNGRGLGDVAQDAIIYGSKLYIAVSFSNTIEAMRLADGVSSRIACIGE